MPTGCAGRPLPPLSFSDGVQGYLMLLLTEQGAPG